MAKPKPEIDKVRASRDGHEYHEAWTARIALQLLCPDSDLTAIAVEGLSPVDQHRASASTVQVADITMYFGGNPTFEEATRTTIAQFKYSIADKEHCFRASKAKKTIEKYAEAYRAHKRKHGAQAVEEKLDFQIITNQPISDSLIASIEALGTNADCSGDVAEQADQLRRAAKLTGRPLAAFARKLSIEGRCGSLPAVHRKLRSLLVDWSATSDPIARARLGQLRELIREKAGSTGTGRNLVTRTDLLAALEIGDPKDLLPCEASLPKVDSIIDREQLAAVMARVSEIGVPLLIKAPGGVGKTVFMQSLATGLKANYEVVLFDCFGGGAYRSPEDARHLPKNGLMHIANTLSFRGLCDPMLPGNPDVQGMLRTFRRRIAQCIQAAEMRSGRQLALLIDAIDNADIAARQGSGDCFPIQLLESLDAKPIAGLKVVVSCRPERKPDTYTRWEELELLPFSQVETAALLRARLGNPTDAEINVAQARSGGNPRVIDYLLGAGRDALHVSEIDKEIELEELIQARITDGLSTARQQGYEQEHIDAFLAGLAVLPPPVPLEECAGAHGIALEAIESFASDLSPLLDRTSQGLMFRDEPTETLLQSRYTSSGDTLRRLASNLLSRQDNSVYAARALPSLLHQLDDTERLFDLAFDDRIPLAITSTVGQRNVRYARLKAATLHAAERKDHNRLVHLLVELSTLVASDQRGSDYILGHPDLVVATQDAEAMRRLFETRTEWPGARHARLAVAYTLSGESEESYRHAGVAEEWTQHYIRTYRQDDMREAGPDHADTAAIPLLLLSRGRGEDAGRYVEQWRDWYAYEVCELVFAYADLARSLGSISGRRIGQFIGGLSSIGALTAALSFQELSRAKRRDLVTSLARQCRSTKKLHLPDTLSRERRFELADGLQKAAATALSVGLPAEARAIASRVPNRRPDLWAFSSSFPRRDVLPFLFHAALETAVRKKPVHERDLLPRELFQICARIGRSVTGKAFRDRAMQRVESCVKGESKKDKPETSGARSLSYDDGQAAERFLVHYLDPLVALTRALSAVLGARSRRVTEAFGELIQEWVTCTERVRGYEDGRTEPFFRLLGFDIAFLALWSRGDIEAAGVQPYLDATCERNVEAHSVVSIVAVLAQREALRVSAGELAKHSRSAIDEVDDVTERVSLLGALGRAMLPASVDEASAYFRDGLEQMDAIGAGDYQFTNELMLFASKMRGDALGEPEFHTLMNICELNVEDPDKFPWGTYGHGISKAAGLRGLAKLSRWDDRSKVTLGDTLLPYLTGLLEHGEVDAADAVILNRLARPVEYYSAGTKQFAEVLRRRGDAAPEAVAELIAQYEDNNPHGVGHGTVDTLRLLAGETLGATSELTRYLSALRVSSGEVRRRRDERGSSRGGTDPSAGERTEEGVRKEQDSLKSIMESCEPSDEVSLSKAVEECDALGNMYHLKGQLFSYLRDKVAYDGRVAYVRGLAGLENLILPWKLEELREARRAWEGSSAALREVYRELALPLVRTHLDELTSHGSLSASYIGEISRVAGVSMADLIIELVRVCAGSDKEVAGSVWLGCGSLICAEASAGEGELALMRLLESDAARLADSVPDGPWVEGMYPADEFVEIAGGMVWRILGSPYASERWRGAHCLRVMAKFDRWEVVDNVVGRMWLTDGGPFQAKELPFFYLHARLWLLIALARLAQDYPAQIGRYEKDLLSCAMEREKPHVLMRHFACRALLASMEAGKLELDPSTDARVRQGDLSPHERLQMKLRRNGGFYAGSPREKQRPTFRFGLDYDFHKLDVDGLAEVFGQPCWKVAEMISSIVHRIDPGVRAMYETGGRESGSRSSSYRMETRYHTHGQQLGWHGLFLAAGELLRDLPVTSDSWYDDDPWGEWFGRYGLTRDDGLWLSDGTDQRPPDTAGYLLEEDLSITGSQAKILDLAGLRCGIDGKLVVEGGWYSGDSVRVLISSALVPADRAAALARGLTREDPMGVWVPRFEGSEEAEFVQAEKEEYTPWIVCPGGEVGLDEHDPYGVGLANERPRLGREFSTFCGLSKADAFGRVWKDRRGRPVLAAEAWGREDGEAEGRGGSGVRLICTSALLRKVLRKYDRDLLLLINLQRYVEEPNGRTGQYTHTVAVARIRQGGDLEYFKGRINHVHKPRW